MNVPSFAEIENGLLPFRAGRQTFANVVTDALLRSNEIVNPLLTLSRLFIRVKSADSIVEKLKRKGIEIKDMANLAAKIPDVLGCRVVVETLDELRSVNRWLQNRFEIISVKENIDNPDEFGGGGIEYLLQFHDQNGTCPVAFQLRTLLQHHWASTSFHLFHKRTPEVAAKHRSALRAFGEALRKAETCAATFHDSPAPQPSLSSGGWPATPICSRIHIVVVEPGERFVVHEQHTLSGKPPEDHAVIVAKKLELYATYPGSAIVECSCLHFLSFMFNEPSVSIPVDRLDRLML